MNERFEQDLAHYYARFQQGHEQRRQQLLASLPLEPRQSVQPARRRLAPLRMPTAKVAAALAATLMIGIMLFSLFMQTDGTSMALAGALEQAGRVENVHFTLSTPNGDEKARVEVWFRRPSDFRMEFGTGLTMTLHNGVRYQQNTPDGPVMVRPDSVPGPELLVLQVGGLAQLFAVADDSFAQQWIQDSSIVSSELTEYKGERCRKVICTHNGQRFEYVIADDATVDHRAPFYEVKLFSETNGDRLLSHMEVLSVNQPVLPESLFVISEK